MTYKLNPQLKLIKNPVILVIGGAEQSYVSGEELTSLVFEKNYIIDSITAREGKVVVALKENNHQFNINWGGRKLLASCEIRKLYELEIK